MDAIEEHLIICDNCASRIKEVRLEVEVERLVTPVVQDMKKIFAEDRTSAFQVIVRQADQVFKDSLAGLEDALRRLLDGFRLATLVPAVGGVLSSDDTRQSRAIELLLHDRKLKLEELSSDAKFEMKLDRDGRNLRLYVPKKMIEKHSTLDVVDGRTRSTIQQIHTDATDGSYVIPLDLLQQGVMLQIRKE